MTPSPVLSLGSAGADGGVREAGLVGRGLAGAAALLVGLLHQIEEQLVWKGLISAQ